MSIFLSGLLTFFQTYGYPALWVSVFIAAVGLPLPIALVLLAAGAFAALGDFNIFILALLTITASVSGDNLGYLIGRKWGSKALDWFERSRFGSRILTPRAIVRSRLYFQRRGGWAIFLSRFLVASLGGVINLISGLEFYPYRSFLTFDFAGETIGAVIPLVLGFAFGASWEELGDILGTLSLFFIALCVTIYLFVQLLRYLRSSSQAAQASEKEKAEAPGIKGIAPLVDPPAPSSDPLSSS